MIKKLVGKIHLWLGLVSGVVVFIVSLTGSIYVFHNEFTGQSRKKAVYVEPSSKQPLPITTLWELAQEKLGPGKEIGWATVYNNPEKSQVFYSYQVSPEGAITYLDYIDHYESVYLNPYSGEVMGHFDEKYDFFNLVKMLHWSLLFTTKIGQPVVGWSTFVFVILLITGLVLWWPGSFRSAKNLFWIRWKKTVPGHRRNYDLHNVLGFYSLSFALIIAFTGMVWSFKWFKGLVYVLAAGNSTPPDMEIQQSVPAMYEVVSPVDWAFEQAQQKYSGADRFRIVPPSDSLAAFNVYVAQKEELYYLTHHLQFDQYSGALLNERTYDEKNSGEKLIAANYDIHVGAILGLPGKIIAFVVGLVCASLPVTGFFVWWNKRRQRKLPLFG